jgi:pimeloyl-ACP methyl ester carboxylesterase
MNRHTFARFLIRTALLLGASTLFAAPLEVGALNGAKFSLARPARWNRCVLLLAHGYRSEDRPLVADLFPEHLAYQSLLEEGWIVAKTSYRRNGIIVADAIADLDALRAHIIDEFGEPDRVLLEGESMGGLIVTLIAERAPGPPGTARAAYQGAVAIGAALNVREANSNLRLSLQPKMPLLFLTNQSELDEPRGYVAARVSREPQNQPALFRVSRDGHVNVNQRERLVALRALNAWLDRGRAALPRAPAGTPFFDATVPPEPLPPQVTPHSDGRGFDAHVTEISGNYGNVFLDAQPADFAAAGIANMTQFRLTAHGETFRVVLGRDFSSVKRGEWVAFPNADGFFWLARNNADAAATARLAVGDVVSIQRDGASPGR